VRFSTVESIREIPAGDWNRLAGDDNPFVRHEFLAALEGQGCLGDRFGWWPRHFLVHDGGRLVAAAPAYLKDNNYGEFVFDHAWSEAYTRAGLPYYPKLVVAVPYTPVTGPRLLADPAAGPLAAETLVSEAIALTERWELSSLHWLFCDPATTAALETRGLSVRTGSQFHWPNPGYRDFQDFLDALTSRRRKEIRRERREVERQRIEVRVLSGREAGPAEWDAIHAFYESTFERKWGVPTLTRGFFEEVGAAQPDAVALVLARKEGRYVAGAFNLLGRRRLYGRNWGTNGFYPGLHFEVCYYRLIELCIERGLEVFEAGAQGEHKVARGFLPRSTRSAHWVRHPGFRSAVVDFVRRERRAVEAYMADVLEHSPYRQADAEPHASPVE
jgi:hypothetical protein